MIIKVKKTFLICFLLLCMILTSCTEQKNPENSVEIPTENETQNDFDPKDLGYKELKLRPATGYAQRSISLVNSNFSLSIPMPIEWILERENDSTVRIIREGSEIGKIQRSHSSISEGYKSVVTEYVKIYDLTVERCIERTLDEDPTFRLKYTYTYVENGVENKLALTVRYSEADVTTDENLFQKIALVNAEGVTQFGYLGDTEIKNVLILGNSFVNTSKIGGILSEMMELNQKNCKVTAVSRGYATVLTYAQDSSMMRDIKTGTYDAVFMCGFYSSDEIYNFSTIVNACKQSGTKLTVFPAHNESDKLAIKAQQNYEGVYLLHWMTEINELIKSGISRNKFCINDEHAHSTPLAGYVGAHMIYRAIYGEIPMEQPSSAISYKEVYSSLGNYVFTANTDLSVIYVM